jgi:CRP/FNR family cyclic AMP-dependent transcriptional regulator
LARQLTCEVSLDCSNASGSHPDDTAGRVVISTFPHASYSQSHLKSYLLNARWVRMLTQAQQALVLESAEERHCKTGECLLHAGDRVEHWTGIVSGFAKMSVTSAQGKVSTLTGVCAGVWFGEGSLMKREQRRYDVVALRPTCLALVPRSVFENLRQTSIPFNHYLQDLLNARLSLFIGTLSDDRLLETDARVAHGLTSLFNEDLYPQANPNVRIDQNEVGLLANVSRQRANVALRRFQELGLIRLERSGLTVLDLSGLRRIAGGLPADTGGSQAGTGDPQADTGGPRP